MKLMALDIQLKLFIFLIVSFSLVGCSAHIRVGFLSDQTNKKLLALTDNEPFVWKDASEIFSIGSNSKSAVAALSSAGYNCSRIAFEINCQRSIGSFAPLHDEFLDVRINVGPQNSISKVSVRHIGVGP